MNVPFICFFRCSFEPPALSQVLGLALRIQPILYMGPIGSNCGENVLATAGKTEAGGPRRQQQTGRRESSQCPLLRGGICWTSVPRSADWRWGAEQMTKRARTFSRRSPVTAEPRHHTSPTRRLGSSDQGGSPQGSLLSPICPHPHTSSRSPSDRAQWP